MNRVRRILRAIRERRAMRSLRLLRRAPPALASGCAVFLDIDGTLLELAPAPDAVYVDPEIAKLLPNVRRSLGGALALITGRSISDVDRLFPGLRMTVAGQHGCERRDALGTLHLHAPRTETLERLRTLFTDFARKYEGLLVEDKGSTLAIHYRQAPQLAAKVHKTMIDGVAATDAKAYRLQPGKQLLELRPDNRDKGTAIRDFMAERPFKGRCPVFIGDDRTDEHGFEVIDQMGGWSVKVGRGRTRARYRLADVSAVRRWLGTHIEEQK
ncbi:MAG TPA: trehalose-phosphatase [Casimicrobiaceae bacterium]|nr:trehalose-phosphatase [Casimicrobiaceae bacterium]